MWRGEKSYPYRDLNSDPSAVQPTTILSIDCGYVIASKKPSPRVLNEIGRVAVLEIQVYWLHRTSQEVSNMFISVNNVGLMVTHLYTCFTQRML
jgi:hypothetical protein